LAGLPTVPGTWIGGFAFAPHWAALFFGVAAGAILQVMVEVTVYALRTARAAGRDWTTGTTLAGFGLGLLVMYATGLLVQV
jgi:zinc transporter ZupT